MGKVKVIGKVKVDGTTGQLTGKCGMPGLRSCKSTKIFLFLTWTRHETTMSRRRSVSRRPG
jgi:hypothetical protein